MAELSDAIGPYNPEEEVDDGLSGLGLPLFSEIAIRELAGNALVHRDYSVNGARSRWSQTWVRSAMATWMFRDDP